MKGAAVVGSGLGFAVSFCMGVNEPLGQNLAISAVSAGLAFIVASIINSVISGRLP